MKLVIDADVVAIDNCVLGAIRLEVTTGARKIRQRKRVYVRERKWREATAARAIAQIVTGNRCAVGREDRADWREYRAAACKTIFSRRSRPQQFAKITDAHSRGRHRH
jgi:hypothetical protein